MKGRAAALAFLGLGAVVVAALGKSSKGRAAAPSLTSELRLVLRFADGAAASAGFDQLAELLEQLAELDPGASVRRGAGGRTVLFAGVGGRGTMGMGPDAESVVFVSSVPRSRASAIADQYRALAEQARADVGAQSIELTIDGRPV